MRRLPVWALAQTGVLTAVEGNVITLAFGPQWKTLHEKMTGENKRALDEAFSQVLGTPVEIDPVLMEGGLPADVAPAAQPAAAEPEEHPLGPVEQVKETFPGSTVVDGTTGSRG
jgi:hypothetical protein